MNLKQLLLSGAQGLNFSQELFSLYDSLFGLPTIQITADSDIQDYTLRATDRKGDVLIPLIPGYQRLCHRVSVLAHAFRTRGYRPIILRDDLDLPGRTGVLADEQDRTQVIEANRYRAKEIPRRFGLETVSIGEILGSEYSPPTPSRPLDSVKYKNIDISNLALATLRKVLRKYTVDLSKEYHRSLYESFIQSGIILADTTEKLVKTYDFVGTISNEPQYIQGGVPLHICEQAGINAYSHGGGFLKDAIFFGQANNRSSSPEFSTQELIENVISKELSDSEKTQIDAIFEARKSGAVIKEQYSPNTGRSLQSNQPVVVGVFTNLVWDDSLGYSEALYQDYFEWLSDTIQALANQPDYQVVVRTHPAETIRGTNQPVSEWLRQEMKPLPENVSLIEPDADIDTYALMTELDTGVVYNSTVGLEMVYDGTPVVVGGYPDYRGFDITYDPDSKSKYKGILTDLEELKCSQYRQQRAQRYAYFLFICKHLDFPYYPPDGGEQSCRVRHEDIVRDSKTFDRIVDCVTAGKEVVATDCKLIE